MQAPAELDVQLRQGVRLLRAPELHGQSHGGCLLLLVCRRQSHVGLLRAGRAALATRGGARPATALALASALALVRWLPAASSAAPCAGQSHGHIARGAGRGHRLGAVLRHFVDRVLAVHFPDVEVPLPQQRVIPQSDARRADEHVPHVPQHGGMARGEERGGPPGPAPQHGLAAEVHGLLAELVPAERLALWWERRLGGARPHAAVHQVPGGMLGCGQGHDIRAAGGWPGQRHGATPAAGCSGRPLPHGGRLRAGAAAAPPAAAYGHHRPARGGRGPHLRAAASWAARWGQGHATGPFFPARMLAAAGAAASAALRAVQHQRGRRGARPPPATIAGRAARRHRVAVGRREAAAP